MKIYHLTLTTTQYASPTYRVTPVLDGAGGDGLGRVRRRRPLLGRPPRLDDPADARVEAVHEHEDVAQVLDDEQRQLVVERSPVRHTQVKKQHYFYTNLNNNHFLLSAIFRYFNFKGNFSAKVSFRSVL
jgi:hypothetical protein